MKILVLNGPNMQLLGTRQPEIYGSTTYGELVDRLQACGRELGIEVDCRQSNHEGELVDLIDQAPGRYTTQWDGRSGGYGTEAPAGIYLVHLIMDGVPVKAQRIVRQ